MKSAFLSLLITILAGTLLCLPTHVFAQKSPVASFGHQVTQAVSIQQDTTGLRFSVQINNLTNQDLTFNLSGDAKNFSANGLQGWYSTSNFVVPAYGSLSINYEMEWTGQNPLYLTSEDQWTPVLQNAGKGIDQIFTVQSQMLPGYHHVDSATGHAEDELDLVFCRCYRYSTPDQRLQIVLVNDEPDLAKLVLTELSSYLAKFEADYGPYPYDSFTVVESIAEVGYAFPKMTWLGSQLLHFPFILRTSLPHELLHSWWGNGVFVDLQNGNWCEGMTVLGTDYGLLTDSDKAAYRMKAIMNYMDYAQGGREIPLAQFKSRGEDRALQAIGYDKSLMVLLMAEQIVGPVVFRETQREFYLRFRFKEASYDDFFTLLEEKSGHPFKNYVSQWIYQPGILPQNVVIGAWDEQAQKSSWNLQTGAATPSLDGLPIAVRVLDTNTITGQDLILRVQGTSVAKEVVDKISSPKGYLLDPDFKLFRELSSEEKPASFSQVFSAATLNVSKQMSPLLGSLQAALPDAHFLQPTILDFSQKATWILALDDVSSSSELQDSLRARGIHIEADRIDLKGEMFELGPRSVFVIVKIQNATVALVSLSTTSSAEKTLRRWTHYGSKNHLVLGGGTAEKQGLWAEEFVRVFQ